MLIDHNKTSRLEAEGLAITRGERTLFENLSFGLDSGRILQIEGRNGCGKTTLLRILCGLTRPSEGRLLWDGQPVDEVAAEFFTDVVYVGHHPAIKDDLSPLENLAVDRVLGRPDPNCDAEQALERLGLDVDYEETPCRKLSAGQRRRVALARLLVTSGKLWVLDEPFTALDVKGRDTIEQLLAEHTRDGGMAILTTHHAVSVDDTPVQLLHLS